MLVLRHRRGDAGGLRKRGRWWSGRENRDRERGRAKELSILRMFFSLSATEEQTVRGERRNLNFFFFFLFWVNLILFFNTERNLILSPTDFGLLKKIQKT